MALIIWIVIAAVLTLWWFNRASVLPVAIIVTYIMIPFAVGSSLTGGNFHPGTIMVLVALGMAVLLRPGIVFREVGQHPLLYLSLAAAVGFLFVTLRFGAGGATIPVDTMLAPIATMLVIRIGSAWGDAAPAMRNTLISISLIQVVIAAVTWVVGRPLLFVDQFSSYYWFTADFTRGMGTTDHPLVLSLLLAATIPLLATLRSVVLQIAILAALVGGLLITESRTGLLAALVGAAYLVFRKGSSIGARIAVVVGAVVAGFFLIQAQVASGVLEKFEDDGGSTSVRFDAVEAFFRRWSEFALLGWGPGGSSSLELQEGLRSSLESAALIYAVNYGVIFTLAYFGIALAFTFLGREPLAGARLAALTALVVVQTFSSIATGSASAVILWIFIALASLSRSAHAVDETARQASSSEVSRTLSTSRSTGTRPAASR